MLSLESSSKCCHSIASNYRIFRMDMRCSHSKILQPKTLPTIRYRILYCYDLALSYFRNCNLYRSIDIASFKENANSRSYSKAHNFESSDCCFSSQLCNEYNLWNNLLEIYLSIDKRSTPSWLHYHRCCPGIGFTD